MFILTRTMTNQCSETGHIKCRKKSKNCNTTKCPLNWDESDCEWLNHAIIKLMQYENSERAKSEKKINTEQEITALLINNNIGADEADDIFCKVKTNLICKAKGVQND